MQKSTSEWRRYVAFSFATSDLLIELDGQGHIHFITGAAEELLGLTTGALQGKRFIDLIAAADRSTLAPAIDELEPGHRLMPRNMHFSLARSPFLLSGFRLPDDPERVYLAISRTVASAMPRKHPERDAATGLLAREDFTALVEDQMQLLHDAAEDAALTMLEFGDLDGLRRRVGPQRFEALLREMGEAMRAHSLGGDAAGMLHEDKYGLIHSPSDTITGLMSELDALVHDADPTGDAHLKRHSINLTTHSLSGQEAAQAIRYAINRFADDDDRSFNIRDLQDGIEQEMADTVARIDTLKQTIAGHGFTLFFQPIVALSDRRIHHHEVLTRFPDGDSPYETISFAEHVGLIADFDIAVASKAAEVVCAPDRSSPPRLAVNLSARSLENDQFIDRLRQIMVADQRLPQAIMFEITESYKVRDLDRANAVTQRLRNDGHHICLDDFGAGGASFDYIQKMDVDVVKLDGIYVRRMMESQRDTYILEAMASLCRKLKIKTVAEFVETEDQAFRLAALGVDMGQGWLFGKAEPTLATQIPKPAVAGRDAARAGRRKGEAVSWA